MAAAALSMGALDALMPLHVACTATGRIETVGRCLAKLCADDPTGSDLLDLIEVKRPHSIADMDALRAVCGARIALVLRHRPELPMRGIAVPLTGGTGLLINLSFGVSLLDAVAGHRLTLSDFAPTDLAIEMLYLIEAKSAALAESKSLNRRLQSAKSDAEARAVTDALTGLGNRRAMEHALTALTRSARDADFGLLHVDLDHFKAVNDTLGHAAGDHVLLRVAEILNQTTRANDVIARVGGDEFVIILRDCNDPDLMQQIGRRIIDRLEEPIPFEDQACRISASIGIAVSSDYPDLDAEVLLSDADAATYASKREGRARVTMHRLL